MTVEKRIHYFKFIRDIPYEIGLKGHTDYCCSAKSKILAPLLESLGLKTRQIICTFDWDDTPLPSNVLNRYREEGETHQFLQVFVPENDTWVNCDPTWDSGLKNAGFEISEWDGLSNTAIAVKPIEIFSPEKTIALMQDHSDPVLIKNHFESHHDFYDALNKWMNTYRIQTVSMTPDTKRQKEMKP